MGGRGGARYREMPSTPSKRQQCNCKNSKCLKLYCECFASAAYCNAACNCITCHNNDRNEAERKVCPCPVPRHLPSSSSGGRERTPAWG